MATLDDLKNEEPVVIVDPNITNSAAKKVEEQVKVETVTVVPQAKESAVVETKEPVVVDIKAVTEQPPYVSDVDPIQKGLDLIDERAEDIKKSFDEFNEVAATKKEIEESSKEVETEEDDFGKEELDEVEKDYEAYYKNERSDSNSISRATEEPKTAETTHVETRKIETPVEAKNESDVSGMFDFDDEDFKELEETTGDEDEMDTEEMKALQKSITDKIKPVTRKLDLASFTISKEAVPMSTVLARTSPSTEKVGDWVLMSTGTPISFKQFSGTEIESLASASNSRGRYQSLRKVYEIFYNHIPENKRPDTFEAWIKSTSFLDIDHLYMGAYNILFDQANHIPYTCPTCKNMWITDNVDIMEMVKFKDETVKSKFNHIRDMEYNPNKGLLKTEVVQISDDFAFGFKEPSIYDIVFETATLDDSFRSKYSQALSIMSYIDQIYLIDATSESMAPVQYKIYPNNTNKTIKSKVVAYGKILSKLSSDQYNTIIAYMREINKPVDDIKYVSPEATCPKCNKVIPETEQLAQDMLFTRHQLTALGTV